MWRSRKREYPLTSTATPTDSRRQCGCLKASAFFNWLYILSTEAASETLGFPPGFALPSYSHPSAKQEKDRLSAVFGLPLAPLRSLSCLLEAEFPSFLGSRVSLEEAFDLELGAKLWLSLDKRSGDTMAERLGLTGDAAAI